MKLIPGVSENPVVTRILAEPDPAEVFSALYGNDNYAVLCQSMDSLGNRGRYSFAAARPLKILESVPEGTRVRTGTSEEIITEHVLTLARELVSQGPCIDAVQPFSGGVLGYIGYETAHIFEPVKPAAQSAVSYPVTQFIVPSEIVIMDHNAGECSIIVYGADAQKRSQEIDGIVRLCTGNRRLCLTSDFSDAQLPRISSNITREEFCKKAARAKEYIREGDVFQVVLSQRFSIKSTAHPFVLYQCLALTNPAPYLYYMKFGEHYILGSSPEMLVESRGGRVITRPLAGTRPRGRSEQEDRRLETGLMLDEKEKAEHVMLVDLARNDLGRVCLPGSVKVDSLLKVEKFSRVMHLVSHVSGTLKPGLDSFDVFRSCFPAGTVSGAPKIRAMQIISELEPAQRGVYAGAMGYFGFDGSTETCIGIRLMQVRNGMCSVQAGAGIVADSDPQREYEETMNKARAVLQAAALAGGES